MSLQNRIKTLYHHSGLRKYLANTSWLFTEKIFRMAVAFFVGLWVARYLGPEQFGLLSYAQSFVALFIAIAAAGLDQLVVRELVNHGNRRDVLLGTAFIIKLAGALLVLLLLITAVHFTSNDIETNTLIFIIGAAVLFQSFNVINFYFRAKVLSRFVVYVHIVSTTVSSVIKILLIINKAPLIYFALVILFDSFIIACGYFIIYKYNHLSIREWKFKKNIAIKLLKDCWPLFLTGILGSIHMKVDQVFIKEMLNNYEVGQYAAAVKISELWYILPAVICGSFFPAVIQGKKKGNHVYYKRLQKLYDIMFLLALFIAVSMTFLNEPVVALLYGEVFNEAADVLMIYIWAGIFHFMATVTTLWLLTENRQKVMLIAISCSAVINILLNYILIPEYGIKGAAIATIISYFSALLAGICLYKRKLMFAIIFHLWKPINKS